MTLPELISELSALGLDAGTTLKVVTLASRYASRDDRDARALAAERARRYRARKSGTNGEAKANDVASIVTQNVTLASRDGRDASCNKKGTSEEVKEEIEVRKKNTEGVNGRASVTRGTRLQSDSLLSDSDRQFALDNGVNNPDAVWAEFIDYWIGIPGQRGTKLDWSATWRNRVRQIAGKPNGRLQKPTLVDIGQELAEQARTLERQAGIGR